jgi:hypothetical protein
MTYKTTLTLTVDLGILGEREAQFAVSYIPATRDVMYLSNGDPGYPGDPAELEILWALVSGVDVTTLLTENDDLYDRLVAQADETYREQDGDYLRDREIDDRLTGDR